MFDTPESNLIGRWIEAKCADRRAKGHRHRAGTPHIVRIGPANVNGAHPATRDYARRAYGAPLTLRA
jgi:hypothetical protein